MAHPRVEEGELVEALTEVFRRHGFEGTSLSKLSAATGLGRASLYHRFPGGKEEMAAAVLAAAGERLESAILGPLRGSGPPRRRLLRMVEEVRRFYHGGREPCLLESLSLGVPETRLGERIRGAVRTWIRQLGELAEESGVDSEGAQRRAEEAVMLIQGALVVSRALQDPGCFERVLAGLPERLLGP